MSKKRVIGAAFMILLGIVIIWWQMNLPIKDAMNQVPGIQYYLKGVVMGPFFLLVGLFALFTPPDIDMLTGLNAG